MRIILYQLFFKSLRIKAYSLEVCIIGLPPWIFKFIYYHLL